MGIKIQKRQKTMLEWLPKIINKPITMEQFNTDYLEQLEHASNFPVKAMYEQLQTKVKQCEELRQLYLKTKNINFAVLLMEELNKLPYKKFENVKVKKTYERM